MFLSKIARQKFAKLWQAIDDADVQPPCQTTDPELWFGDIVATNYRVARSLCNRCPVKKQCLDYAVSNHEPYGMWGGKSPKQRLKLRPASK